MKERLAAWLARLDALQPKERVLVTAAALLALGMLWLEFGFDPMSAERRALLGRIASTQTRIAEADELGLRIVEAAQRDPDVPLRRGLERTEAAIAEFEAEIRERAGELLAPREIAGVLRQVLEQTRGLEFVRLEGLGAQPLLAAKKKAADEDVPAGGANAYRHGFRITFNGSYLDTIAYLRALEGLPWRFFWDAVDLQVEQHPRARVSVVVYTLSLDRRWIGV